MKRGQQNFLDVTIKKKPIRDCISSACEFAFKNALLKIGFEEGKDFVHQHCFHDAETLIVVDFYFPKLSLVVELDGSSHRRGVERASDRKRDRICEANGIATVRISTPIEKAKEVYWLRFLHELKRASEEGREGEVN